jgi:transcriptional regulator with XRE-family HTH domain
VAFPQVRVQAFFSRSGIAMTTNQVRQLRASRGWSMDRLAQEIGTTTSTINRIEKGETALINDCLPLLATLFNVTWYEVCGVNSTSAAQDECVKATSDQANKLGISAVQGHEFWRAEASTLSAIGIARGDLIIARLPEIEQTHSQKAKLTCGQIVIVSADVGPMKGKLLLRQFISPDLYITNSLTENSPSLIGETNKMQCFDSACKPISVSRIAREA